MATSLLAILTGLVFVNIIKPGVGAGIGLNHSASEVSFVQKPLSETLIEIIPENIFQSFAESQMLSIIFLP
ncbi:MAG: dicarboxylate/amino acid:cation symporter [Bacteroidales bacterium]|nr:dicarboxylate/amino acid:cation symporter [Bacteroidales bacterium]